MLRHQKVGAALGEAGDEWAAVCWFYSAYHLIKATMLVDPLWNNPAAFHALHPDLNPDDRFVDRHRGRRRVGGPTEWGVNELVALLYPKAAAPYERLHQASIKVRYSTGLPSAALPSLPRDLEALCAMDAAGGLMAPQPRK